LQLEKAMEELNRGWYERNTGRRVSDVQRRVRHSATPWMATTLDGILEGAETVLRRDTAWTPGVYATKPGATDSRPNSDRKFRRSTILPRLSPAPSQRPSKPFCFRSRTKLIPDVV
jgi:hypothetical protein